MLSGQTFVCGLVFFVFKPCMESGRQTEEFAILSRPHRSHGRISNVGYHFVDSNYYHNIIMFFHNLVTLFYILLELVSFHINHMKN